MAGVGIEQHRHEGPRTDVHATPADIEGLLPLTAIVDDEAPSATDAGVVEQQVKLRTMAGSHVVAELEHARLVRDIGDERGDAHTGGRSRFGERLGLGHVVGRHVAHRHVRPGRGKLAHQFAPHAGATTGDHSHTSLESIHGQFPPRYARSGWQSDTMSA